MRRENSRKNNGQKKKRERDREKKKNFKLRIPLFGHVSSNNDKKATRA
jgi:hypothetical protein